MLKFINDNDFLLVDKYKQNDDGSVSWIYNDGNATHSGFIRDGMTRIDGEDTIDVWAKLQTELSLGNINIDDSEILSEKLASAKEVINSKRDQLNVEDVVYNGHTFQTDPQSKEDIMGAVVTGTDTIWLTRNNEEVEMSADDMKSLGMVIANRKKELVYKARGFKDTLLTLESVSEIEQFLSNLDWSV